MVPCIVSGRGDAEEKEGSAQSSCPEYCLSSKQGRESGRCPAVHPQCAGQQTDSQLMVGVELPGEPLCLTTSALPCEDLSSPTLAPACSFPRALLFVKFTFIAVMGLKPQLYMGCILVPQGSS